MNDKSKKIDQEEFNEVADRLVVEALTAAAKMTPGAQEVTVNATFMVLIAHTAARACLFMARGQKVGTVKAANLLHKQIVGMINRSKIRGENDETRNS